MHKLEIRNWQQEITFKTLFCKLINTFLNISSAKEEIIMEMRKSLEPSNNENNDISKFLDASTRMLERKSAFSLMAYVRKVKATT